GSGSAASPQASRRAFEFRPASRVDPPTTTTEDNVLALLAQVFAFHAAWGAPPRPPPPPPPAMLSPRRAVAEALWYCRDRGLACRPDGARLTRGEVWRLRVGAGGWGQSESGMVLELGGWCGEVAPPSCLPACGWSWS